MIFVYFQQIVAHPFQKGGCKGKTTVKGNDRIQTFPAGMWCCTAMRPTALPSGPSWQTLLWWRLGPWSFHVLYGWPITNLEQHWLIWNLGSWHQKSPANLCRHGRSQCHIVMIEIQIQAILNNHPPPQGNVPSADQIVSSHMRNVTNAHWRSFSFSLWRLPSLGSSEVVALNHLESYGSSMCIIHLPYNYLRV